MGHFAQEPDTHERLPASSKSLKPISFLTQMPPKVHVEPELKNFLSQKCMWMKNITSPRTSFSDTPTIIKAWIHHDKENQILKLNWDQMVVLSKTVSPQNLVGKYLVLRYQDLDPEQNNVFHCFLGNFHKQKYAYRTISSLFISKGKFFMEELDGKQKDNIWKSFFLLILRIILTRYIWPQS